MTRTLKVAGSVATASSADVEKAIAPLVRLLESLVTSRATAPIDWMPASAIGLSNTQASRVARRYGLRASKLGKATLLHRGDLESFLARAAGEDCPAGDDDSAGEVNEIAERWGLVANGGRR